MSRGWLLSLTRCAVVVASLWAMAIVATAADLATPQQIASRIESAPQEHPLVPALRLAETALQKIAATPDYEALFVKKEYVNGTYMEQKMQIRFRRQPMSVYLKFMEPHEGRQVLFVKGQNAGQLQVKDAGLASLVGTLSLDPNGSVAMAETKYSITMIGMENMTRRIMSEWLDATHRDDITVKFYPNAKIGDVQCQVIESTHTEFKKSKGIYRARLYIAKESGLPIRIQEYGPPTAGGEPPMISDYAYLNVRTDLGLTAYDFDTRNPRYGF